MKTLIIKIDGMRCNHCTSAVNDGLSALSGVSDVSVNLEEKQATITYDEAVTNIDIFKSTIEDLGFDVIE